MVRALILAAGAGHRFGSPKQLAPLRGKPLFLHAVDTYLGMREIAEVILVVPGGRARTFLRALGGRPVKVVAGGRTRLASVRAGLRHLPDEGLVVLQNAASPLTSAALVRRCLKAARATGAATAFVPASHTVFRRRKDRLGPVLERAELGYACDPQVFETALLRRAVASSRGRRDRPTVDLVRRLGRPVRLVESGLGNLKVTTEADLAAVAALL